MVGRPRPHSDVRNEFTREIIKKQKGVKCTQIVPDLRRCFCNILEIVAASKI